MDLYGDKGTTRNKHTRLVLVQYTERGDTHGFFRGQGHDTEKAYKTSSSIVYRESRYAWIYTGTRARHKTSIQDQFQYSIQREAKRLDLYGDKGTTPNKHTRLNLVQYTERGDTHGFIPGQGHDTKQAYKTSSSIVYRERRYAWIYTGTRARHVTSIQDQFQYSIQREAIRMDLYGDQGTTRNR